MAIRELDSFDLYNGTGTETGLQAKWVNVGTLARVTMQTGLTGSGGQCVRLGTSASSTTTTWGHIYRSVTASSSFSLGISIRTSSLSYASLVSNCPIVLASSGTAMLGLRINADGSVDVHRLTSLTAAGTVLGTSATGLILANTKHHIEFSGTINDSTGTINVYLDGQSTPIISLTGQDTRNGTPTTVNEVRFVVGGGASTSTDGILFSFDDLYWNDATGQNGELIVETTRPDSDVAQGFTRSTGSTNYTLVDETTANGDTDYVSGSTIGDVDTYGFGDLASTPSSVKAVQATCFAKKTDTGARSIALQIKSGATTSDGSDYALAASYQKLDRLLDVNPDGGGAWSSTTVNALQGGPKVTV